MTRLLQRILKSLLVISIFVSLSIVFYFALLDALYRSDSLPEEAYSPLKPTLSKSDRRLEVLFEKSAKWAALSTEEKRKHLLENPVYATYGISKPVQKERVNVLLIISSGPRRGDRRDALRKTWLKECVTTAGVTIRCIFFTDNQKPTDKLYDSINAEASTYNDTYQQPLRGGVEFGARFLYHMVWAMSHYDFDYFLRIDDDYFLCLERLLKELPLPMENYFHWGYTHCILEIVRPEESIILLSRDIVEKYLYQDPHKMRCHPLADQMIGVWTTDINMHNLYRTDERLHHTPIVEKSPELRHINNVCHKYIGIHGTYPKDMFRFWEHRGDSIPAFKSLKERDSEIGNLVMNSEVCDLAHSFNYLVFEPEWQYEPKRCVYSPIWDTRKQAVVGGIYMGREEDQRLSNEDVKNRNKRYYEKIRENDRLWND